MRCSIRIISVILTFVMLFSCFSITAFAAEDKEYLSVDNFGNWAARQSEWLHTIIGFTCSSVCSESEDARHHSSNYLQETNSPGIFRCVCDLCGEVFNATSIDIEQSYDAYVEELPAPGIDSDGALYFTIPHSVLSIKSVSFKPSSLVYCEHDSDSDHTLFSDTNGTLACSPSSVLFVSSSSSGIYSPRFSYCSSLVVPITGTYSLVSDYNVVGSLRDSHGDVWSPYNYYTNYSINSSGYKMAGEYISCSFAPMFSSDVTYGVRVEFSFSAPVYRCVPETGLLNPTEDTTYNISSRVTSLNGDIGIIGDNGQLTKVNGKQIFNETTNNYYNPTTDNSSTVTSWQYDYSDRSYNLTLESGDTITVTYGDENITIEEGDVTYNVYYVTTVQGDIAPDGHVHQWELTDSVSPTCTTSGSNTYTCSECGETKTEVVPATGHSWSILRSVQTKYDENGELIQEGYTLYECSVCGEQYKDVSSTGPPGGSGQGGGSGDNEGDSGSIWDKLGELVGTIGNGILGAIEAILSKLLDALISLAAMIAEKLTAVVDVVLNIFEAVPALFTGFLGFLQAAFPFIPADCILLLTFGIAAIVFIGIIKAVRR